MHLKELSINGFKSFARKSELEFTTPITAIVGPNGSGKSNVAEAFRFVLGEQSIKSMRGKKGEDLIWGGSESVARSNRASVTIKLDNALKNGTRVFPIDFDEITVERVVNRDGTNEYSINGSKTRLKDVQELLAAANVGPTGHHIISQGEADRILSASPRERREMIEDALGLKVYQFKKAESERKLKKTRENIAQVESLRREVAPHLRFLEKQIKKVEKSLALQDELKTFYAEYLKREDTYIAYHHDRLTEARRLPEKEREELRHKLESAKEKLKKGGDDTMKHELVHLEENVSRARERRQEVSRSVGQLEGQILFLERQIASEKKKQETESDAPIPRAEVRKVLEEAEKARAQAEKGESMNIVLRAIEDIVHAISLLVSRSFGSHADALQAYEKELGELKHTKATAETEVEKIRHEEEKLGGEYQALKGRIESESVESREAEREVFALMNQVREVEQKLDALDRELSELSRARDDFKNELQEAVSLIGRGAAAYFEYSVKREDGTELSSDEVVKEDRSVQQNRRRELERMKIRLEELGTGSNEDVLREYQEVKERDEFLEREIVDLTESVAKLEALIEELTRDLNEQFVSGIEKISAEFSKFFTLMFGGGSTELIRVKPKVKSEAGFDEDGEPLVGEEEAGEEEEGIEIDVKLPNKRVRGLDMLSGGERALTSIALIFAMSQVNPPLFVILDETDAALDEANSRRYGDMISALAEKSQLILITHNRETMGRAGVLYGVTMAGDGVSKLLSVKFEEAVAVAK